MRYYILRFRAHESANQKLLTALAQMCQRLFEVPHRLEQVAQQKKKTKHAISQTKVEYLSKGKIKNKPEPTKNQYIL